MNESRRTSSGAGAVLRELLPQPALCAFLLLLALVFTVSYAVGAAAGPIAPGMHGESKSRGDGDPGESGTDGMGDMHEGGH